MINGHHKNLLNTRPNQVNNIPFETTLFKFHKIKFFELKTKPLKKHLNLDTKTEREMSFSKKISPLSQQMKGTNPIKFFAPVTRMDKTCFRKFHMDLLNMTDGKKCV